MSDDLTAAVAEFSNVMQTHDDSIVRVLAAATEAKVLGDSVLWLADPSDAHSDELARKVLGKGYAKYAAAVAADSVSRSRRPAFIFALRRDFAAAQAREVSEEVAERLQTYAGANEVWCVFNMDGVLLCKTILYFPLSAVVGVTN